MATQYTSILKLALPTEGELSGTWGDVVNDNITSMVEEAIAGRAVINTWTTNSHTLTTADGTTAEARCAMLEFTDTGTALTGAGTVICPTASKIYIAKNDAGQAITLKTSAGTGIAVPDGETMFLFCDGTNVVEAITSVKTLKIADGVQVNTILDEDDLVSDSATALATQQSIKAYVDAQVTAQDLDIAGDSGTGAIDLDSQSLTVAGTSNEVETSASGQTITVGLPSAVIVTTSVTTPTVQATNINANDGSTSATIADVTGVMTIASSVLTTTDINGGTVDGTTIGGSTAAAGTFTTATTTTGVVTDTISERTATSGVTIDGVVLKDNGITATGGGSLTGTWSDLGTVTTVDIDGGSVDGATLGTNSAITEAQVDNININGNTISSTDTNGNIALTPDGTGEVDISKVDIDSGAIDNTVIGGTTTAAGSFTTLQADTSLNVDGTVTADGLTVDGTTDINGNFLSIGDGTGSPEIELLASTSGTSTIDFGDSADSNIGRIEYEHTNNAMTIRTNNNERMRIDSSGNVGIGTSSPQAKLDVSGVGNFSTGYETFTGDGLHIQCSGTGGDGNYTGGISFSRISADNNSRAAGIAGVQGADADQVGLAFLTHPSAVTSDSLVEAMRIDSSGNVGIGTTSPARQLDIYDDGTNGQSVLAITAQNTDPSRIMFADTDDNNIGILDYHHSDNSMRFTVNNDERMRIDSDGNVGIGATSPRGLFDLRGLNNTGGVTFFFSNTSDIGNTTPFIDLRFTQRSNNADNGRIRSGRDDIYSASASTMDSFMAFYTALNNADTERMRIDSSGNVGIGTTSPANKLHVVGGSARVERTGKGTLAVLDDTPYATGVGGTVDLGGNYRAVGDYGAFVRIAAEKVNSINNDFGFNMSFYVTTNGGSTLGKKAATFNSIGNLVFPNGQGIDFSASEGGGATSSVLDDYEEGTWTPTYTGSGGTATYSIRAGVYTKIGRLVYFAGQLQAGKNTLTGNVDITGLPFSGTEDGSGMYIGFARSFTGMTTDQELRGYVTGTTIELRIQHTNSAGSVGLGVGEMSASTSDNYIYFSGSYHTTS